MDKNYMVAKGGLVPISGAEDRPPDVVPLADRDKLGMRTIRDEWFCGAIDLGTATSCEVEVWGAKTVQLPSPSTDRELKWFRAEDSVYTIDENWTESFNPKGYERMTLRVSAVAGGDVYKYEWTITPPRAR